MDFTCNEIEMDLTKNALKCFLRQTRFKMDFTKNAFG